MKVVTTTAETYGADVVNIYPKTGRIKCIEVWEDKMVMWVENPDGVVHHKKFAYKDLLTMHKALTKIFAKHKKKGGKN